MEISTVFGGLGAVVLSFLLLISVSGATDRLIDREAATTTATCNIYLAPQNCKNK